MLGTAYAYFSHCEGNVGPEVIICGEGPETMTRCEGKRGSRGNNTIRAW